MKRLIDVLVEEIKVWPDHMTHLWISTGNTIYGKNGAFEFSMDGGWDQPQDYVSATVSRAEWQDAVDALKAEQAAELDWPDGATHYVPPQASNENGVFYRVENDFAVESWIPDSCGFIHNKKTPVRAQRHHLPGTIPRPTELATDKAEPEEPVVEWDGVGFPPVGAVVHTDHKRKEMTVKILAYGQHHKDDCVLVADMSHGFEGKMFGWIASRCVFRPIKTAEQIAADEREKAIIEIRNDLDVPTAIAERAYNKGYRKASKSEGES